MNLFGIRISLPGEATMQRSKKNLQGIADYQRMAYQDLYANPQTPYDKAQYGQLQASALRGTQTAAQQLQRNLMQRGLGQSSLASNALSGLWSQYGQQLANARLQQMGLYDQRRLAALQGLGGVSGIYGQLGQMGAQEYGRLLGILAWLQRQIK